MLPVLLEYIKRINLEFVQSIEESQMGKYAQSINKTSTSPLDVSSCYQVGTCLGVHWMVLTFYGTQTPLRIR